MHRLTPTINKLHLQHVRVCMRYENRTSEFFHELGVIVHMFIGDAVREFVLFVEQAAVFQYH